MKCKLYIYMLLAAVLPGALMSCNSDDEDGDSSAEEVVITSSVGITSFSLGKDDKVLANLDSVFFTIDLANAVVYNADSLPKGTDVSKIVVNIGLPSVSAATLEYNNAAGEKESVDYLVSPLDSIDFSHGNVKLHLVSYNEVDTRDYELKINVHKMVADSLYWDRAAVRPLPTTLASPEEQHTVDLGDKVLCFTRSSEGSCVTAAEDPSGEWSNKVSHIPADVLLNSITATNDALYAVTSAGALTVSVDEGVNWNATGAHMTHILGGYENRVVGVREAGGKYYHVTYPATTESVVSADFPVAGTSQAVTYRTEWSSQPLMIVIGGATTSGALTGSTWAYDGTGWGCLSATGLPEAEGMCLVPYFSYLVSNQWVATRHATLLAIGGFAKNSAQTKVYISVDRGLHWRVADKCMQLPDYFPAVSYAQSVVRFTKVTETKAGGLWREMPVNGLPVWYVGSETRAIVPITEWDCPYVYVFGGDTSSGLNVNVWRGVINRMTFKPIQ